MNRALQKPPTWTVNRHRLQEKLVPSRQRLGKGWSNNRNLFGSIHFIPKKKNNPPLPSGFSRAKHSTDLTPTLYSQPAESSSSASVSLPIGTGRTKQRTNLSFFAWLKQAGSVSFSHWVCVAEGELDFPSLAWWTQAVLLSPCLGTVSGATEWVEPSPMTSTNEKTKWGNQLGSISILLSPTPVGSLTFTLHTQAAAMKLNDTEWELVDTLVLAHSYPTSVLVGSYKASVKCPKWCEVRLSVFQCPQPHVSGNQWEAEPSPPAGLNKMEWDGGRRLVITLLSSPLG